jgi:hypothetical protein
MLYLDCLENDLNLLEKTDQNKVITLPFLEQSNNLQKRALEHCASAFYPNSFFNRVLLKNGSFDKFLNEPLKIHFNVPFQNKNCSITGKDTLVSPSRIALTGRLLKPDPKGRFPEGQISGANLTANESLNLPLEKQKRFLEDKIQGFSTENNIKKMSDIVHEKMFLSQLILKNEAGAYQVSNQTTLDNALTGIAREGDGQSRPHGTVKPKRDPHAYGPQTKFYKLNKKTNPPVTSFLRACTLLDKYMVYKPIVQDLQTEPVLLQTSEKKKNYLNQNIADRSISFRKSTRPSGNRPFGSGFKSRPVRAIREGDTKVCFPDVKPELIDKLFSYFSNESTYLSSQKLINKSTDTDNVFLNSLNKNQKEDLSPTFDFSFVNNFSPKKVTIIFKKLSFLDSGQISGANLTFRKRHFSDFSGKKTNADKTTNLPVSSPVREEIKLFCPEGKNLWCPHGPLNSKESGIRTNPKIYNKISKDKLYKIVLSTLKQTLNKSSSLSDSSLNETSKPFFSTKSTVDSYNIDSYSRNKSDVENLPTGKHTKMSPSRVDPKGRFSEGRVDFLKEIDLSGKFSSVRTIKFKPNPPILMSNKSEYPSLSSKNKSVSSGKDTKVSPSRIALTGRLLKPDPKGRFPEGQISKANLTALKI